MRLGLWGACAALFVVTAAPGCSSSEPAPPRDRAPVASAAQALQGAVVDQDHPWAVGVCGGGRGAGCQSICSGTLILPNLVATARHCVDGAPQRIRCIDKLSFGARKFGEYWITTHYQSTNQSTIGWHQVQAIAVPKDDLMCGNDIALLVLDDLVPAAEAVPAIPNVHFSMVDPRYGKKFTAIGFGVTSANGGGAGTRRILEGMDILCLPGDPKIDCPVSLDLPASEFVAGDGVCSGDSGSGAFDQVSFDAGGPPISFGVVSRGGEDGNVCKASVYTRLDSHRDLVVQTAVAASKNWTLYPKPNPDWTIYTPPPVPDAGPGPPPPPPPPPLKDFGEGCGSGAECASGRCLGPSPDDQRCTKTCTPGEAGTCPEDYVCEGEPSLCVVSAPDPGGSKTTTTTGCATRGPSDPTQWRWGLFVIGAALLRRRRRR
jgi:MYXO-CTERM domain-containing protein